MADCYHPTVVDGLGEARALFDPAPGTIYLDSATYGLPPRPTVEAMHRAVDEWQAGTADWVRAWDMRGEDCRAAFGALIGVPKECVALLPSASVGVGTTAASLGVSPTAIAFAGQAVGTSTVPATVTVTSSSRSRYSGYQTSSSW